MRLPVRWRLTLAFSAVMALVLATAGLFIHERMRSNLDRSIDIALRSRSADVAALAQQSDTGLREARLARATAGRTQIAQIIDGRGRVVDHAVGVSATALVRGAALAKAERGPTMLDARAAGDQPVRLRAVPVRAQDQKLVVVVGQSLEERDRALGDLNDVLALGGPAALLLACLAGYVLTGAAFRPVEAMRGRAAAISASDLASRLPSAGGNDELGRLGRTLNEMLGRIDRAVARERTFIADASHELRTPLAMVRTELELIARDRPTGAELESAARSAIAETDSLTRLANDLLVLTRSAHGQLPLHVDSFPIRALLDSAAARARRRVGRPNVQISVADLADMRVAGDRDRLGQALDNLIENSLRHGGRSIRLTATEEHQMVAVHVVDDGPGFPPDFLSRAFERFSRAATGRTADGAGLGLAIVRAIAEGHGGEAGAANSRGGADVWITLPLATAGPDGAEAGPDRSPNDRRFQPERR